jgi:hypothetical protein
MNVYGPDETPSAEDASTVEAKYDSKLLEWRDEGLIYWDNGSNRNTEEIPDRVFSVLCDLMENEVRNQFKSDNPPVQRMAQEVALLRRLRRHLAKKPSGESTPFSSY